MVAERGAQTRRGARNTQQPKDGKEQSDSLEPGAHSGLISAWCAPRTSSQQRDEQQRASADVRLHHWPSWPGFTLKDRCCGQGRDAACCPFTALVACTCLCHNLLCDCLHDVPSCQLDGTQA